MKALVKIVIEAPEKCTEKELKQWIEFELGLNGQISLKNPLSSYTLQDEILEDETEVEIEVIK